MHKGSRKIVDKYSSANKEQTVPEAKSPRRFQLWLNQHITRPSVNYANDWLDHSFHVPGLEKGFTLDVITRAQSTSISMCNGPFSACWHPTEQTNNQVSLVQACSWPVRRKSFAIVRVSLSMFLVVTQPLNRSHKLSWRDAESDMLKNPKMYPPKLY